MGTISSITKEISITNNIDYLYDHIDLTAKKLNLSRYAVEKDIYVTKILHILSEVRNDFYRLVFQGGTCLSKAHHLTKRMSEDCDFRIEAKEGVSKLSRTKQRSSLKSFREDIVHRLQEEGFNILKENMRIRDEGRFVNMRIQYDSLYNKSQTLKPFLAVDFFLTDVKTPVEKKPVTTMIKDTLGNDISHPIKNIECVSIIETAAEKWIGLTRRIATIKERDYYNDPSLVRHIFDLYTINEAKPLDDKFSHLVNDLLDKETVKFKTHNEKYFQNPKKEIKAALETLKKNKEWKNNWDQFMRDMVYEDHPPSYEKAIACLELISDQCFSKMKTKPQQHDQWSDVKYAEEWEKLRKCTADKQIEWLLKYYDLYQKATDQTKKDKIAHSMKVVINQSILNEKSAGVIEKASPQLFKFFRAAFGLKRARAEIVKDR